MEREVRFELASVYNNQAMHWSDCPDPELRDPAKGLEQIELALQLSPDQRSFWNTKGLCLFRLGKHRECLVAFERSMQLANGGDAYDWFFVAMARHALGEHELATQRMAEAIEWTEQHAPNDDSLTRYREEAKRFLSESAE